MDKCECKANFCFPKHTSRGNCNETPAFKVTLTEILNDDYEFTACHFCTTSQLEHFIKEQTEYNCCDSTGISVEVI